MKTLKFKIEIAASPEKIWNVLWNDETYWQWTSVFCEGTSVSETYAVSDWNEGSKIHFLSASGDGMNAIIDKKIDYEYMAFKHISELKNFVEMPIDIATEQWTGAMETYRLTPKGATTILDTTVDSVEKYADYFEKTFPKALEIVKKLSEEQ